MSTEQKPTPSSSDALPSGQKMAQSKVALSVVKTNNHPIATEAAVNLEDIYNEICNLVGEMRIALARQTDVEHRSKINEFFACQPPSFGHDPDPLLAKLWIFRLDLLFNCVGCSDEQKVSFAVLRLEDDALCWWMVEERGLKADGVPVTWEKFKELFYERYFPHWMQREKYTELCNLEQGDRTVAEYNQEFIRLSSLASEYVPNDGWKASLFDRGLRPEISIHLCVLNDTSYPRVRDMALMLEQRLNNQRERD